MIRLCDVKKCYYLANSKRITVIDKLSLHIKKGEFVAIMGRSGTGKSTLLNILGCLDTPTSGSYYLDNLSIANMSGSELANIRKRYIGFIFQSFHLLPKHNIIDNIALPLVYHGMQKIDRETLALEFLTKVGLTQYSKYLPTQLSGGQQQRIAIARALVTEPNLIIADEPTGNLDTLSTANIMELFMEMHDLGKTIILVTHDAEVAQYAQRTIHINDGKIQSTCM
jgi:putative ABC transport system ATP-binding protein